MIKQLATNGEIDPEMLYESPFTRYHESGISGAFPDNATNIISIIQEANWRALLG